MDITVKKESGFVTRKRRDLIFYTVFIALPVLQFLIFYLAVNLNSFKMALQEYNMDTGEYSWIGLENFAKIFTNFKMDVMYTTALKNSIIAQWNSYGPLARTAFDSQALLQLSFEYCRKRLCATCPIGKRILNALAQPEVEDVPDDED